MMKPSTVRRDYRIPLAVASGVAFLGYVGWFAHTPGEPRTVEDLSFLLELFGPLFVLLGYIVWSWSVWGDTAGERNEGTFRSRMALGGSILGAGSALLLLLLLPFWDIVVQYERMAELWIGAGVLMALAGTGCGVLGAPRLRRPAILSGLLLPFWGSSAALMLKAVLD